MPASARARTVLAAAAALPLAWIVSGAGPGSAAVASAGAASPSMAPVGQAQSVPAGSTNLGPEVTGTPLSIDVVLSPRDPAALASFVREVSDPGSPQYHHYLARGDFGSRFGAAPSTISQVTATLRSEGLTPGPVNPNDLVIPVQTSVSGAESAFHVHIDRYHLPTGRVARANTTPPQVTATIARSVVGVNGLSDVALLQSKVMVGAAKARAKPELVPATSGPAPCSLASAVTGSYTADQIAHAYGFDVGAYDNGRLGAGETIALFELEPFSSSDVGAFQTCYGISTDDAMVNVTTTPVDGGADGVPQSGEAALDVEVLTGLAPDASIDVYEAPDSGSSALDEYAQIANDDSAQTVSTSWGLCEPLTTSAMVLSEQLVFEQMAAQGQSLVAAAGDSGSEDCYGLDASTSLAVDDPASDPYVTGVGGTTLESIGPPTTETAWNESAIFDGAGGGGISPLWSMPSWQRASAADPTLGREVPDVSASADPAAGFAFYFDGGWGRAGGTSLSAPIWGALVGLADEGCGAGVRAGFLNPALYAHPADLNDITSGNNDYTGTNGGLYPAGVGYDMATGLGTPTSALFAPGVLCNSEIPSKLGVTTQVPSSSLLGQGFAVGISVEDASSNVISTDSTTAVALAISSGSGTPGATLSCAGGDSVTVTAGLASFDCSIDDAGSYTLTASATDLVPVATSRLVVAPSAPPPPTGAVSSNSCSSFGSCTVLNDSTTVRASGVGALTLAQYGSDPVGNPTFSSANEYLDVQIAVGSSFSAASIVDCNLNGGASLQWWSGSSWLPVSPQNGITGTPPCVTVVLNATSVPSIADLTGTVFGVANAPPPGPAPSPSAPPPSGLLPPPTPKAGYWMVGSDGGVFGFGDAGYVGSLPGVGVKVADIVGMVSTADGKGYWMVGSDGGVFGFGDAGYVGSLPGLGVKVADIVGMVPTGDGKGYWMVGSDGGVFGFGDARYVGSMPGVGIRVSNIVALVPTPDGGGYWMVGSDGGVFSFGDAAYVGSLPALGVRVGDIIGMVPTGSGEGYWMVGADGGVFTFGDAAYMGSLPALGVKVADIVGMVPTASGRGYWMGGSDGGVFGFGDAGYVGSLPGIGVRVSNIVALVRSR